MSKFHKLNIVSFFLLIAILASGVQTIILIVILGIFYLSTVVLGSTIIQHNFYFKSRNKGELTKKQIALTFDDGPDSKITPNILSILAKHKAKASFFCIGEKAQKLGGLLKEMDKGGHLLGNHSYSHSNIFSLYTTKRMVNELQLTNEIIAINIGKSPKLFRPPFGVTNPTIGKAIKKTGLISVGWSLRSLDTVKTPEKVLNKIKRNLKPGDVVLFHDNRTHTPEVLNMLLPWLYENQFEIIALDKLFKMDAYERN